MTPVCRPPLGTFHPLTRVGLISALRWVRFTRSFPGPPGQRPGAGGPEATPARSAGSRDSRPSPQSEAGHDRLNQLRPTTLRFPTPGPPHVPSTHRSSTSRPGAAVARPTCRRHPPATRPAQPASGATNQPWCQRPGASRRWAVDGGVWKGLVSEGLAGTGFVIGRILLGRFSNWIINHYEKACYGVLPRSQTKGGPVLFRQL